MRPGLVALAVTLLLTSAGAAQAQSSLLAGAPEHGPAGALAPRVPDAREVDELERLHRASLGVRRSLADAVLIAGLVSVGGGATLIIPDGSDQALRFAGINTAIFGAVNTIVGALALRGIGREARAWESAEARAARRTPGGLVRARIHAALDERRESVAHAINLGLGCAYAGVGGTAILASRLGVDHPDRWLASGVAIGVQAAFLIGVDFIGVTRSAGFHRAFVEGLAPTLSVAPTSAGSDTRLGIRGTF